MKVLHINTNDSEGGAGDFSSDFIHNSGINSHLIVKEKKVNSEKISEFQHNFLDDTLFFLDKIVWKAGLRKTIRQVFSLTDNCNFTFQKLSRINEYRDADIVHLHNIHGGYFDLSALLKIVREKPIVWSMHDMWAMTGGEAFTFDNENYKKGIGKTPYAHIYPLFSPLIDLRQHFLEKKKRIYREIADNIVFVPGCHWLADCLRTSFVWNEKMKIRVIHECIDTSVFYDYGQRNWEIPRILIVNSNNPFKGSEIFEKFFTIFNGNFELHIIGNPLKMTTNAKQTRLYDYINSKSALSAVFNSVDILIFPSIAENFSLTTLSAMSCGVCVIGNSAGGLNEQLADGNGLLFNYYNLDDILEKLQKATGNISLARAIGKKAGKTVSEKYNVKEMYEKYNMLYRQLLNEAKR